MRVSLVAILMEFSHVLSNKRQDIFFRNFKQCLCVCAMQLGRNVLISSTGYIYNHIIHIHLHHDMILLNYL